MALLETLYRFSATAGLMACLLSGMARLSGTFYIFGFEVLTLYQMGLGIILVSILLKLELIQRSQSER